ncbi:MAG: serine protease [Polyangiales bacterium]
MFITKATMAIAKGSSCRYWYAMSYKQSVRSMRVFIALAWIMGSSSGCSSEQNPVEPIALNTTDPSESLPEAIVGSTQTFSLRPQLVPTNGETKIWKETIAFDDASFIKPHFSEFDLQDGDELIVKSATGRVIETLTARGPKSRGVFWGLSAFGNVLDLEFHYRHAYVQAPFEIDRVVTGNGAIGGRTRTFAPKTICGASDFENVACYQSDSGTWANVRASVGIMDVGGNPDGDALYCSGTNVSPSNLVLTNAHCLNTQSQCDDAEFVFQYYRTDCENANSPTSEWASFRCDELLKTSPFSSCTPTANTLDFSLFSVIGDPSAQFGSATIDPTPPVSGQGIYMVQHPSGRPHEITHGGGSDFVVSGLGLQYQGTLDTEPGSSGSPIFDAVTHKMIGLHHCGGCANEGMRMTDIYPLIAEYLGPSIGLSLNSSPLDLCVGDTTASTTVDVRFLNGLVGPVSLALANVPADLRVSLSTTTLNTSGEVVVDVEAPSNLSAGSYDWTLIASAPDTDDRAFAMHLDAVGGATAPDVVLDAPIDGAKVDAASLSLAVAPYAKATSYLFEVASDEAFESIVFSKTSITNEVSVDEGLRMGGTYYWRASVLTACGTKASAVRHFQINAVLSKTNEALSGAKDSFVVFSVEIPSNATRLRFEMSGGTGDADLYVRAGAEPTKSLYDCRPYSSGNSELCTFTTPSSTQYFIGLNGFREYSGTNVTTSYSVPVLDYDAPIITSLLAGTTQRFFVPAITIEKTLMVETTGDNGNLDLYVSKDAYVERDNAHCAAVGNDGVENRCTINGPQQNAELNVLVVANEDSENVQLRATTCSLSSSARSVGSSAGLGWLVVVVGLVGIRRRRTGSR